MLFAHILLREMHLQTTLIWNWLSQELESQILGLCPSKRWAGLIADVFLLWERSTSSSSRTDIFPSPGHTCSSTSCKEKSRARGCAQGWRKGYRWAFISWLAINPGHNCPIAEAKLCPMDWNQARRRAHDNVSWFIWSPIRASSSRSNALFKSESRDRCRGLCRALQLFLSFIRERKGKKESCARLIHGILKRKS